MTLKANGAMTEVPLNSPCTKLCMLGSDDVCLGCFRHLTEIATWSALTPQEQRRVLAAAAVRRQAAGVKLGA